VQSTVRQRYYPKKQDTPWHRRASISRLRSVEIGERIQAPYPDEASTSVSSVPAPDARRIDAFRLFVALIGLTVYLGVPAAALIYLAVKIAD